MNATETEAKATYVVNYMGKDFTDCSQKTVVERNGWKNDILTVRYRIDYRVPEGYDGTIVAVRDGRREWKDGEYIYDVADENTVFYRLSAAVIENQEK